jgi:hypothetical protein
MWLVFFDFGASKFDYMPPESFLDLVNTNSGRSR